MFAIVAGVVSQDLLIYVQISLWERYLDAVLVQRVIYDFLDSSRNDELLFDKHPNADFQVDTALSKLAEGDCDWDIRVCQHLSVLSFLMAKRLQSLDDELTNLLDIGSISHSDRNPDEFVAVVSRHILEGLAEESAVQESNHAAVIRDDLCALIGDALHFSCNSVTLNIVANMNSARHEADSIEEVLQDTLHGKAKTRSQTCAHNAYAISGNTEKNEHDDNVKAPAKNADDVAGQRLVDGFAASGILFPVVKVETSQSIVDIAENEVECRSHADSEERNANQIRLIDNVASENLSAKTRHLENLGRPIYADKY